MQSQPTTSTLTRRRRSVTILTVVLVLVVLGTAVGACQRNELPKVTEPKVTDPPTVVDPKDPSSIDVSRPTETEPEDLPALNFVLTDQHGVEHELADYKGKVIFLNFWATWCPPCRREIPDIEAMYRDRGKNEKDVVVLSVVYPATEDDPNNPEKNEAGIQDFIRDNDMTYPVLFDREGKVFFLHHIQSLPTTFIIDADHHYFGYIPGGLQREMMERFVDQALGYDPLRP